MATDFLKILKSDLGEDRLILIFVTLDDQIGADSAKTETVRQWPMTLEQQHDELMDRIRDFRAEVDALVGPISPEQAVELRKRYQELCAERNLLQTLHDLQPN